MKKFFIILLILIAVAGSLYFIDYKFNVIENIKEKYFNKESEKGPEKESEVPKLKIINEDSNSRIYAVVINNNHVAWPHAGLRDSFLSYELIAEGGITRIMALFKDKETEKIGSVRSARHYFLDYVLENDAIFVHFGHSERALKDIKSLGISNINGMYDSKGFWRDTTIKKASEHTAFTSIEKIKNVIAKKGYRITTEQDNLLNYSIDPVEIYAMEGTLKADKIEIVYSGYHTTSFEYDEGNKIYKRFMSGIPHTDAITNEQYTAKNIITYQIANKSFDKYGRQELNNIGTGTGYYITNGYAVPIVWEKETRASQTVYKYTNGEEIDVNDGNTWIQIQPKGKKLNIIDNTPVTPENEEQKEN